MIILWRAYVRWTFNVAISVDGEVRHGHGIWRYDEKKGEIMQSHTITPVFVPFFLIKYGSRGKYRKEGWAHIWNVVRKTWIYMVVGGKEKRRWLLVVEHAKKKRMMARKAIITQKSKLVENVIIIIVIVSTI